MVSLEILFSYTVLGAVAFLLAIVAASYLGTRAALNQFFDERRTDESA
ncbi:hypothetical protein [Halostagnicola sp. A-GB9-2]|nr:hypothetical protein [Halostagnicola sp. A-GB9-2]MDJ1432684.1 hypothetical protein [Halostagnicola sp. A-GB9-2]